MMSVLSRMLTTQRYRPRAANVGHATPVLHEVPLTEEVLPLLVTNARQLFVPTHLSRDGNARAGFSEVPVDDEPRLVYALALALLARYRHEGCPMAQGLAEANRWMRASKVLPSTVIASVSSVARRAGLPVEEVRRLQAKQGFVVQQEQTQMLALDLPDRMLLLCASAPELGQQVRVGDHVAVMLYRADRSVLLAVDDAQDAPPTSDGLDG